MRLQVNEEKSGVRKPDDLHFLGFRFGGKTEGKGDDVAVLPSAKAERRLRIIVREMTPPNWGRSIAACMNDVSALPDRLDEPLSALHAGSGSRVGRHRRPYPSPDQGDHRPPEEAATLPLPTSESQRRQRRSRCPLCVLQQWSMGEVKPTGDDKGLSPDLVRRADGLTQGPVARPQPTKGISPARAGALMNRSKSRMRDPHVRFCERRGGTILRAYSTTAPGAGAAPSSDFSESRVA